MNKYGIFIEGNIIATFDNLIDALVIDHKLAKKSEIRIKINGIWKPYL